jgi:type III secretion protein J
MPKYMTGARATTLALILLLGACSKVPLYNKLSERDANEALAALMTGGIEASKSASGEKFWLLEVDKRDLASALEILRAQGLPREQHANLGELFRKEGLVSTPSEERIRYIYALSQELSQTLTQIDGVQVARVHVVIPANDPLSETIKPSSAAVFVKHRAEANLLSLGPAIKNLVAGSIEGIAHENIALSFFPAEAHTTGAALEAAARSSVPPRTLVAALLAAFALAIAALAWRYRAAIGEDWFSLRQALAKRRSLRSLKS